MENNDVIVIGAGIVGLCTALSLRQANFNVTVIDPQEPGSQCSSGNAGALSSGSVAPLAMPGVLKSAPKMLLDPDGPLHIPLNYLAQATPWLLRFVAAAEPARVTAIADAMQGLLHGALEAHRAIAALAGCSGRIRATGHLHVYPDAAAMQKDAASWQLRRERGLNIVTVDAAQIAALEPAVSAGYRTGYFLPDEGWVTDPLRYAQAIAGKLREMDVQFVSAKALRLHRPDGRWQVTTSSGEMHATHVVVAAGAWSAQLLRPLGMRIPLESQRGYHLQFAQPGVALSRVVVAADRKVFITPMEGGLRVAGTVEFGGLSRPPNTRRAALMGGHAKAVLQGLDMSGETTTWMGHRPCMPDSMPVLGAAPGRAGLWCAFGHGHLGLTASANTGNLLAQAMRGNTDPRLLPFSAARF